MTLTVGSLFSGIGGLDLGLERAGMRVIWQSEIDPYACRVLAKHWPNIPNLGDITTVDWSSVERPDVICGGYPCQPFSLAGVRQGEADPRHLWPHFADALGVLRPRFALLENVPGHLSLGFGRVLGDLADLGYDADWECVPAAAVGAPHLRYRVFVVAHADHAGRGEQRGSVAASPQLATAQHRGHVPDAGGHLLRIEPVDIGRRNGTAVIGDDGEDWHVADTDGERRLEGTEPVGLGISVGSQHRNVRRQVAHTPSVPWGVGNGDGAANGDHWSSEPDVGRVAHGVPARVDRLRTLGNAVVPQVAEWVGRRIVEAAA